MYLGNGRGFEYRWCVYDEGRMLMVGQEAARQGPLGALMAAASALEEQEKQEGTQGRGGGGRGREWGWGGWAGYVGWVREKGCFGVGFGVFCVLTYLQKPERKSCMTTE